MNYVWELAIKAKRADIEQNSITYIFDDDFSPYLELSFVDLNEKGIPSKVAINPYYRYYIVFKELLNSDISMGDMEFKEMLLNIDFLRNNLPEELFKTIFFPEVSWDEKEFRELLANDEFIQKNIIEDIRQEYLLAHRQNHKYLSDPRINGLRHRNLKADSPELVAAVFDVAVHHLINIDVFMGMNKREYYINFVIRDMHKGYFGRHVKENINLFTRDEQVIIANNLIALHTMGEEIYLLKDSVRRIFKGSYIFSNAEERDEIIFFLRTMKTPEKQEKMALLQYLFLPFKCECDIYWDKIFGIIDVVELMVIGDMMQY